ncbi:MAG: hypothetical protein ACFFG0_00040 [Candidatus Thorarchaeota archaeon]
MRSPNGCKGCKLSGHYINCRLRLYRKLSEVNNCPCQTCLVKITCNISCEKHDNFLEKLDLS